MARNLSFISLFRLKYLANSSTTMCSNPIRRAMSHYPIDDEMFGLNEEQRQVMGKNLYVYRNEWEKH